MAEEKRQPFEAEKSAGCQKVVKRRQEVAESLQEASVWLQKASWRQLRKIGPGTMETRLVVMVQHIEMALQESGYGCHRKWQAE